MIGYADINNFMNWFIGQTYTLINGVMSNLGQITWFNGSISLSGFIISITILNVFLAIILNSTRLTGNKITNKIERKKK